MSTARAEPRPALRAALAGLALSLAAATLTGCSLGPDDAGTGPAGGPAGVAGATASDGGAQGAGAPSTGTGAGDNLPDVSGIDVPPDLASAFNRLLTRRSRAVRNGDRDAFLAGLDPRKPGFVAAQNGYFDNLTQLPLARLRYRLDRGSLVRQSAGYSVVVELTLQLEGYDRLPVRSLDRFHFRRLDDGRFALSSATDRRWREANGIRQQPWDMRPIQVRTAVGVLGIFDEESVTASRSLLRSFERGIADVAPRVPYAWDRTVVVYALSDLAFLDELDDLPGDDPEALDALAFTVPAGPGDPRVAATRIVVNPRLLRRTGPARDRLVRHELTHVAVAEHDDEAPIWLSEGIAEWVSVQPMAPQDRQVSDRALEEAERGISTMPDAATFNDADSEVHYAVAWWASEYLAATYGASAPWSVLDAFAAPVASERQTIKTLLTFPPDALARRGVKLMLATYEPEPDPEPDPSTEVTPGTSPPSSDGASPTQ